MTTSLSAVLGDGEIWALAVAQMMKENAMSKSAAV